MRRRKISAGNTIFFEAEIVHGFIYSFLYLLPVRSALDEFVDVLGRKLVSEGARTLKQSTTYLGSVSTSVASDVSHNLSQVLRVFYNIDMSKHLEVRKFRDDRWNLEGGYECVVRIQVRNDLEATIQRDDLTLDVLLQDSTKRRL